MSAIEFDDYEDEGLPVLEITVADVRASVEAQEPYEASLVAGSQEFCLVACAVLRFTGADYVEVDYFGRADFTKGVAVTKHGDAPIEKWRLPHEITQLAVAFDRKFDDYTVTREEALAWLKTRSR